MSVNKNNTELIKKAATYAVSAALGALTSVLLIIASAALMYALGFPPYAAGFLSLFSFGAGCMVSGFICGCIKKHSGLIHGFRCAVIMVALVMLGSLLFGTLDGTSAIAKILTAVVTGCTGGVLGVNKAA